MTLRDQPEQPVLCAVALGANLPSRAGSPEQTVGAAFERLAALPLTQFVASSKLRTTTPQGPSTQGQPPYVNACAALRTLLTPRGLLAMLLDIERDFGRVRALDARNAPRTLDLDLLLFGDLVVDDHASYPALVLPHPRLHERRFVLEPLADVLPGVRVPGLQRTALELLARLPGP